MKQNVTIVLAAAVMTLSVSWIKAARAASVQPSETGPIPVRLVERQGRYTLLRGGQPYDIKGAGISDLNIESFAAHGGNSFRTWGENADVSSQQILDEAKKHGVTVALCIPIGRERHGFDYDDERAVARQFGFAREEVLRYKDHPALLAWIIGNEPDLQFTNPKVFDAINDISRMIHEVDGNHPTTSALSGINRDLAEIVAARAPDLDIISVQKYADIVNVPRYIEEAGIEKPYLITEWGPKGHWEVSRTSWGAPIEPNSSEKAAHYLKSYENSIAPYPDRILGSFAFLWGQKQERTPTWYGMFLAEGSETETIDVMHYIWNDEWPENRSPRIETMLLDSRNSNQDVTLRAGVPYEAKVVADDLDGDTLEYRWEIMRESQATQVGGDKEQVPEVMAGLVTDTKGDGTAVVTPRETGAYRLFVYVHDSQGHAGHANIPFLVK